MRSSLPLPDDPEPLDPEAARRSGAVRRPRAARAAAGGPAVRRLPLPLEPGSAAGARAAEPLPDESSPLEPLPEIRCRRSAARARAPDDPEPLEPDGPGPEEPEPPPTRSGVGVSAATRS